jgi:TatA/E family protein of Tat protein translocase
MYFPSEFAFIDYIGGPELLLVMFVVLLLFGGEKLPQLARTLGKSLNELKKASSEVEREIKKAMEEEPAKPTSIEQPASPAPYSGIVPDESPYPHLNTPSPLSPKTEDPAPPRIPPGEPKA